MSNVECDVLRCASQDEFSAKAESMGFEVWGPNPRSGSILLRESDGRAWLFSAPAVVNAMRTRTVVPSIVTPLNIAVMTGQPTEGL